MISHHNDVLAFIRLGHLIMATSSILAERATGGEPLQFWLERPVNRGTESTLTSEAASSVREEIYRVATTVSPSVTQKFMRLGWNDIQ